MSTLDDLVSSIRSVSGRDNLSVRAIALRAGMPVRSLQNVLDGHVPSITRAEEICDALGLELYIGPPRSAGSEISGVPDAPGLVPVTDRRVAAMLGALADEYQAMNPHGREALAARFNIAFPELRRATVSRIVAFLGWQGSDPPAPEPEPGSGRPDREGVSGR